MAGSEREAALLEEDQRSGFSPLSPLSPLRRSDSAGEEALGGSSGGGGAPVQTDSETAPLTGSIRRYGGRS
jgi:hypothetical protein